jgi:hypothetical protein
MNLLETFDSLLQQWRGVFSQERTFERARRLTFGLLSCLRMHLTSTAICASGRQFQDWSADYRVCSRSPWEPRQLFDVVLDHLPELLPSAQAPVLVAIDDTILKKTSRRIPGVKVLRDPMRNARKRVTALPREFLLWSALRASVCVSQPTRGSRTGARSAGALRLRPARQQAQEECFR